MMDKGIFFLKKMHLCGFVFSLIFPYTMQFSNHFANPVLNICQFRSQGCGNARFFCHPRPLRIYQPRIEKKAALCKLKALLFEEDDERDFREADVSGKRLFVTSLASTVDDVRLYLAFEPIGGLVEAHVVKPGKQMRLFCSE
jgi:hypothetical protein